MDAATKSVQFYLISVTLETPQKHLTKSETSVCFLFTIVP